MDSQANLIKYISSEVEDAYPGFSSEISYFRPVIDSWWTGAIRVLGWTVAAVGCGAMSGATAGAAAFWCGTLAFEAAVNSEIYSAIDNVGPPQGGGNDDSNPVGPNGSAGEGDSKPIIKE